MTQLWAWEYEGKTEVGTQKPGNSCVFKSAASEAIPILRHTDHITNLRKVKVVDADVATKTYLTTDQFIKVWKSLDESKQKELQAARFAAQFTIRSAAWDAARNAARDADLDAYLGATWFATRQAARRAALGADWYAIGGAVWYADLAIFVRDKITHDQFNILVQPWTSCGLSLYAEDWDEVLNPKVVEPKNFGAIVEASSKTKKVETHSRFTHIGEGLWVEEGIPHKRYYFDELINPTIISEGVEG